MFYLAGGFFGAFLFGETEKYFTHWYNNAGYYGRLTLDQVFGLPIGVVVTLLVLMALFMFWGAEQLERIFGKRDLSKEPKIRAAGAAVLLALAIGVIFIGSPSTNQKYAQASLTRTHYQETGEEKDGVKVLEAVQVQMSPDEALQGREMQIEPAELFTALHDQKIKPIMLDVRSEAEYNLFHIRGAQNVPLEQVKDLVPALLAKHTPNRVIIVMSNDETAATQAWKSLIAESIPNVYILEGGLNNWIAAFGEDDPGIAGKSPTTGDDQLEYIFPAALGDRYECADPDPIDYEDLEFNTKIQLQLKRDKSGGGCG